MRSWWIGGLAAAALAPGSALAQPGSQAGAAPRAEAPRHAEPLKDENLLAPMPNGFKVGYSTRQGGQFIAELVPQAESVQDWSQMVTEQIVFGARNVDPDMLPQGIAANWPKACPGGEARKLAATTENGFPVSLWQFVCPLNPASGKPETMWMKVISGADSLYSVQYAYRKPAAADLIPPTLAYLKRVVACDTRRPDRPCPTAK